MLLKKPDISWTYSRVGYHLKNQEIVEQKAKFNLMLFDEKILGIFTTQKLYAIP